MTEQDLADLEEGRRARLAREQYAQQQLENLKRFKQALNNPPEGTVLLTNEPVMLASLCLYYGSYPERDGDEDRYYYVAGLAGSVVPRLSYGSFTSALGNVPPTFFLLQEGDWEWERGEWERGEREY